MAFKTYVTGIIIKKSLVKVQEWWTRLPKNYKSDQHKFRILNRTILNILVNENCKHNIFFYKNRRHLTKNWLIHKELNRTSTQNQLYHDISAFYNITQSFNLKKKLQI